MAVIPLAQVNQKKRDTWRPFFANAFNKAVGGQNTQGILAVWYAWITAESGKTIYVNNPMNLTCGKGDGCYVGQIGYYHFAGNTRNFVAFDTPQHGADAVAALLINNPQYRYPPIVMAARAGSYQAMIEAISASCWVSCSRPGYMNKNGITLYSIWNGLRTNVAADMAGGLLDAAPGDTTYTGPTLESALGHSVTLSSPADVRATVTELLTKYPGLTNAGLGVYLVDFIGHPSNTIPFNFPGVPGQDPSLNRDKSAPSSDDPLTAASKALASIAGLIAKLFDPTTYLRTGALLLGLIMLFTGFKMLVDATSGSPAPAIG